MQKLPSEAAIVQCRAMGFPLYQPLIQTLFVSIFRVFRGLEKMSPRGPLRSFVLVGQSLTCGGRCTPRYNRVVFTKLNLRASCNLAPLQSKISLRVPGGLYGELLPPEKLLNQGVDVAGHPYANLAGIFLLPKESAWNRLLDKDSVHDGLRVLISLMSKKPAAQTTAAPKKGHSDPKTLPVPRPLSPRSGAAQKLPAPKPDSSGSGAAQRVVSGLRLRTTFSVAGGESVWGGGLCVAGGDLAWVGGQGSVRTIDTAGRVTRTVSGVCGSESRCDRIVRGDDGEVYVGSYLDGKISRVSADGAVSTFSKLTFRPDGLAQLSSGRLLVCGGWEGLYTVTGRGVQGVELGVDVKYAVDVSVNSKGDVAVADYYGGKVCILDGQYKHVGTYSPTKSGPFYPESLTSDGENFVICDCYNRTIDTIDRRGVCLSVYPTTDDCRSSPYRVDMLPSNCVWVRFGGGHVCVYDQI
ncbi:hypothetical protein ScPMuIL_009385 [Solemya velum]